MMFLGGILYVFDIRVVQILEKLLIFALVYVFFDNNNI